MVDKIGNFIGGTYREIAKGFMNVLKESKFYEEGVLTPEEFVLAGDYLTQKCPTWKWCSNKTNIISVEYLPKDKQFLTTTVPCTQRASDLAINKTIIKENNLESGWTEAIFEHDKTRNNINKEDQKLTKEIDFDKLNINENNKNKIIINTEDNYIDSGIEPFEDDNISSDKPQENNKDNNCYIVEINEDELIKSRTYDVTVTYDYYYRVPRMWLIGYSEEGQPLKDNEIKQDIMLEYIDKTVTIEKHPNLGVKSVSIHPCRHSTLIKKFILNFEQRGQKLDVEKSILLFLKFLSSIVPTIEYDFTMDIDI